MDPLQSAHINLARLDLRVESLEKTAAASSQEFKQDIRFVDGRISAVELKGVAMDSALQSIVESRRLVTAAVIANLIGLGTALLFLIPVMLDRINTSQPSRPPVTVIK
jgi:hypothetical protein